MFYSTLKETGRAAVVVPDNVLFEGGAGEKNPPDIAPALRLFHPITATTGIWYSPGVTANVLFFDKKPLTKTPATKEYGCISAFQPTFLAPAESYSN